MFASFNYIPGQQNTNDKYEDQLDQLKQQY